MKDGSSILLYDWLTEVYMFNFFAFSISGMLLLAAASYTSNFFNFF